MHADRQVGIGCLEGHQSLVVLLKLLEVPLHTTDVIMFRADAIQRQINNDLRLRAALADSFDLLRNPMCQQAVGRNVDDAASARRSNRAGRADVAT